MSKSVMFYYCFLTHITTLPADGSQTMKISRNLEDWCTLKSLLKSTYDRLARQKNVKNTAALRSRLWYPGPCFVKSLKESNASSQ